MQTSTKRYQVIKRVTWVSVLCNALLGVFKVLVGTLGHSHALVADGIHSFSDLLSDALVLLAAKMGNKSADEDHPYGHGRIETAATAIIATILILVGFWLAYDMLSRLFEHAAHHKPTLSVLIVATVAILTNEWLYHYGKRAGERVNSSLLLSNAWHHRSDALVSLVVLVSVIGTYFGIHYLDAIGSIIIAVLIAKMGVKMLWDSFKELVDTGVDEVMLQEMKHCISAVEGVASVHQLRTRLLRGAVFVDVHALVEPTISVSEGHYVGDTIMRELFQKFASIQDVTVHIDPEDDEKFVPSSILPGRKEVRAQLIACWREIAGAEQTDKLILHYLEGKIKVEVYLPLAVLSTNKDIAKQLQRAVDGVVSVGQVTVFYQ